jgi:hypothetical protein
MIDKNLNYAIAGVSADPEKYGFRVFKDLLDAGYRVWGINPKGEDILEQKIYTNINDLPNLPDWLILVTQPEVSEKLVKEAISLGIKNIWLQPGSESQSAIDACKEAGINCISQACIMIKRRET